MEERLAAAELAFDQTVEHHAEVDGVPINDMDAYRVVSPPYMFTVPDDNIIGVSGGEYGPSINAGYYYLVSRSPSESIPSILASPFKTHSLAISLRISPIT